MAQTHDFERAFGFVLHEAARLLSKRFDQKARTIGLTRAQCSVLFRLSMQEGLNQARLAELMEMEPISLARLVDRMEQAGWIERRADPADKRARRLYMTAKAKPVYERMMEVGLETRGEALAGISQADRDRIVDLLIQVRRNLSERGDAGARA